jgi:hypothetical protein
MILKVAEIRPHLIMFLYNGFEGTEASYMGKSVRSVRFLPSSSVGRYLYSLCEYKRKQRGKQDIYFFYLEVERKKASFKGTLYVDQNGLKYVVRLEEEKIKALNDLLEDMFRVSFTMWMDAAVSNGVSICNAVHQFIEKYELYETGFDYETLRALYKREKKTNRLSRMQYQSSNRVLNYSA